MADTEEYFPRGGKKPISTNFKQSSNFLGAPEKAEKKKKRPKKKPEGDDGYLSDDDFNSVDKSNVQCANGLSNMTIKPGMQILGRVRYAQETRVSVMLPCLMMGNVMACHVSDTYNKLLEAYVNDQTDKVPSLSTMFRPGQYVAVHVLETKLNPMLSLMPQHVNSGLVHEDLQPGCLLQAAVCSVEEHGYVMDVGVAGVRAFLAKTDSNTEDLLEPGSITWCNIKSSSGSVGAAVLALAAGGGSRPGKKMRPGVAVDFTVHKSLDNGIEGRIRGSSAFIQRPHADISTKRPALGQKIRARVLYVLPPRNTPYLTARDVLDTAQPALADEQKLKEGDIVEDAQVIKISGRSIHFKLGGAGAGCMAARRLRVDENRTDEDVIADSYPLGSTHKVRILCYSLCDYCYTVTDEKNVLAERYFNIDQLSPGELVTAKVKSASDDGLVLIIGRVSGFVPRIHMTDAGVFVDPKKGSSNKLPKKKFKEGQEVRARVLNVDPTKNTVYLTLKPSLLAEDLQLLDSYDQADVGSSYTGFIRQIRDYIIVTFFNNVSALVPRYYVARQPPDNLTDGYHIGQIVKCTILKKDPENRKLLASFITEPFLPGTRKEPREKKKRKIEKESVKKEETEPVTKKKKKKSLDVEEDTDTNNKKKKKDKKSKHVEETSEEQETKPKKKDKESKKSKRDKESEESDAIETDIYEDSDAALTPQDKQLIDLTDCVTAKHYKKRIVSILKSINARTRRIDRVNKKIAEIEDKGLDARNKKYHTAMHMEIMMAEERVAKLMEALTIAQAKLKDFNEDKPDYKTKKELKKEAENPKAEKPIKEGSKKIRAADVKVVENMKPAVEMPSAKDFWSDTVEMKEVVEESSSSDEEPQEAPKKKRKKLSAAEKVAKVRAEEEKLRALEKKAIGSDTAPASSDQFERALLARPNCSELWIAYMAFHLQATEVEKARAVGRRALDTIGFRELGERRNVWLALLNTDHRFGTKESQQKTLEEALQTNEPYEIHSKLLDILVDTGKHQELSSLVDLMLKKYKRQVDMYGVCGAACYKLGMVEKARQVMQKAISVLEKKEHVSVLVQFALLERDSGARERAEALFEQVLAVYPQRVDVCAVYIDMLYKAGDVEQVRQVMDRMTSQQLPARKMKILYKKWAEIEERVGDLDQVEMVRQRAMQFINEAKF